MHVIEHVVRTLAAKREEEDERELAVAIVTHFLHDADHAPDQTTYGGGVEKYAAAEALRPGLDRVPRYFIDHQTGEYVVRAGDMATAARRYTGATVPRAMLDARMRAIDWSRVRLEGWERPGRNDRGGHAKVSVYRGHLADG